ncbi:MAG: hypothetical protein QOH64_2095 [Acidimicrobiaceae bacterium]
MSDTDLTASLQALADSVGERKALDTQWIAARGRQIRRRRRRSLTAALAALAIIAGVTVWPRGTDRPVSVTTAVTAPPMTVAELASAQWTQLPPSPLGPRDGSAVVWTGAELIVWGGQPSENPYGPPVGDGAAYTPTTRSWRVLPDTPLTPRIGTTSVWTGTEMVVWGGAEANDSTATVNDGAAFNPITNTWRRLAPSPLTPRAYAQGTWTGHELVILSNTADGARYDPSIDQWQPLPPLPNADAHPSGQLVAVWAGDRLVVANEWGAFNQISSTTSSGSWGIDFLILDPTTNTWNTVPPSDTAPFGITQLVWTGTGVVAPTAQMWCSSASCPATLFPPGAQLDLATERWRPMSGGPVDDGSGTSVWTGGALLHVASASIGGERQIRPGDSALWDPATDTWTAIARAPLAPNMAAMFWTGHEVLVWGDLYEPSSQTSTVGGLRLAPPQAASTTTLGQTEPTGAPSDNPRECRASDLTGRGGRQGENGGAHGDIELTTTGAVACVLNDYPTVVLTSDGVALPIEQGPPSAASRPVLVGTDPSHPVDLVVYWSNWCTQDPGPLQVELTLQHDGGTLSVPFDGPPVYNYVPRCDAPDQASTILIVDYIAR